MTDDFPSLITTVGGVISDIYLNGMPGPMNSTTEKIGYNFDITIQEYRGMKKYTRDLHRSLIDLENLYENILGLDFRQKGRQEKYHYDMLEAGIIHTARATEYFFHQGPDVSRKNIFFSNDCISSIQMLVRPYEILMMVHFRSSDAINLLPVDLHALLRILDRYLQVNHIGFEDKKVSIRCTFGSIHILDEDAELAKTINKRIKFRRWG